MTWIAFQLLRFLIEYVGRDKSNEFKSVLGSDYSCTTSDSSDEVEYFRYFRRRF